MIDDLKELTEMIQNARGVRKPRNVPPHGEKLSTESCDEVTEDETETDLLKNVKMWSTNGDDFFATERAVKELEPGQYVVRRSDHHGVYFSRQDINLDDLLVLPDSNPEQVLDTIEYFWNNEEKFRRHGFLWKRGILLWGPPGSGKTCTVQQLSQQIVDMGGITIYCDSPTYTAHGLSLLRRIEPTRPVVVIIEDMDAIIARFGESELLAMLDGEHQTDNVVFIATTNYPQDLDDRFINRPSRFDEIIKIGMPTAAARQYYLAAKNPRLLEDEAVATAELAEWVSITEGFSIAHLKELIISVECFGKTLEEASVRLRQMIEATAAMYSNSTDSTFGFVNTNSSDNTKVAKSPGRVIRRGGDGSDGGG